MVSSVGNTALLAVTGSLAPTGVGSTSTLVILGGVAPSAIGNTATLVVAGTTSISSFAGTAPISLSGNAGSPDINNSSVNLSTTWSFQEDPTNIGVTNGWYAPGFNVSGWPAILSGQSWESQFPGFYSGYGWYVQTVPITLPLLDNNWVVLSLDRVNGNVDTWWNGTLLTGANRGNYRYKNINAINYYLPPSAIQSSNTLAIRCWGGNLDGLNSSGLGGVQSLSLASLSPMWARPASGTLSQEVPLAAYDLSSAQNGAAFEIVLRVQPTQIIGLSNPYITYSLLSLYDGNPISSGLTAISLGSDGIYRSIINISGQTSVAVYLSGNIDILWNVINYVPGPMTDTGQQIVVNTGGGTSFTMEIWSQTWAAGTVTLPPDGSNINHGMYIPIIPTGVGLSNLVVDDTLSVGGIPDSTYWAFETNLQVGSLVNGDRTYTIQTLPSLVTGMQFIQTSANSKFFGGSPPLQGPMATFTINTPTTIYLAIDTRVIPALWEPAGQVFTVVQTPSTSITFNMQFYGQFVTAGSIVVLPPDRNQTPHGMYFVAITDNTVVISNLIIYDNLTDTDSQGNPTTDAALWSVQQNLQAGQLINLDRTYTFQTIPAYYQGAQWIQTAQNSKNYGGDPAGLGPMAQFTVSKDCWVWLAVDTRVPVPGGITSTAKQLLFAARDLTPLPPLTPTFNATPFGNLQLIDQINCATPTISETHPYLQGGFGGSHLQDFNTPGSTVVVNTETVLGQSCRNINYGYFAYRVGTGALVPGKQYVLALTYPEDVPRYVQCEIQAGQGYFETGWKNGLTSYIYDPWPTSGTWQTFYQVFSLGTQTTSFGGAESGDATNGVWVYILGKVSLPNSYWSIYTAGSAIGTISLYAIDPVANAPQINLPAGLPQRILTWDWERQLQMPVADICNYGVLMGYNTISPLVGMKWGTEHLAPPLAGYATCGVDPQGWFWGNNYVAGSGIPPPPKFAGVPSYHEQFLTETAAVGLNYIPRFEYGGSIDLPQAAWSINAAGAFAQPNRYNSLPVAGGAGANLVNPAVTTELKAFFASFVQPYTGFSNFKGVLWRIRRDTMQISYGTADIAQFSATTGNLPPSGLTAAQLAMWASTGSIQPLYASWWHGVRAAFHYGLLSTLQGYRSDLIMLYYNWDVDKWSMLAPDLNSANFYGKLGSEGAAVAYGNDLAVREGFTAADYTTAIATGNFATTVSVKRPEPTYYPDYGVVPSLYTTPGFRIFCPVNYNAYALSDYINYFKTADGVAVSHAVSYDEIAAREPNPKYEGTMQVPGGGSFSMALEVMSWAFSDVNTLTYTSYTFGRGFADFHRAFAQAFLALPNIPSSTPGGMPANITVRTYVSGSNTYIGVANTATVAQNVSINVPGSWTPGVAITDLVANSTTVTATVGGALPMTLMMAPMQLSAFLAIPATLPPPPSGITWVPVGQCIS